MIPRVEHANNCVPRTRSPRRAVTHTILVTQGAVRSRQGRLSRREPGILFTSTITADGQDVLVNRLTGVLGRGNIGANRGQLFGRLHRSNFLVGHGNGPGVPARGDVRLNLFRIGRADVTRSSNRISLGFAAGIAPGNRRCLVRGCLNYTPLRLRTNT